MESSCELADIQPPLRFASPPFLAIPARNNEKAMPFFWYSTCAVSQDIAVDLTRYYGVFPLRPEYADNALLRGITSCLDLVLDIRRAFIKPVQ